MSAMKYEISISALRFPLSSSGDPFDIERNELTTKKDGLRRPPYN